MNEFDWIDPGKLVDQELDLILSEKSPADSVKGYVPVYKFEMFLKGKLERIGNIELRIGETYRLKMYCGHIAYQVNPKHRGHHYAARSCLLLFSLAKRHEVKVIWITCNPENRASRKTIELVGGKLIEIVDLPKNIDMYQEGERQKCRYRIDL